MGPTLGNSCWNRQFCWIRQVLFQASLQWKNRTGSQPRMTLWISSLPGQGVVSLGELSFVLSFKAAPMSLSDQWNNRSGGGTVKSIVTECEVLPSPAGRLDVVFLRTGWGEAKLQHWSLDWMISLGSPLTLYFSDFSGATEKGFIHFQQEERAVGILLYLLSTESKPWSPTWKPLPQLWASSFPARSCFGCTQHCYSIINGPGQIHWSRQEHKI